MTSAHAPAARQKHELSFGRFVVRYSITGEGRRWMVLLNGAQQTQAAWHLFIRRFRKEYRILLIDFPGQGRSKVLDSNPRVTIQECSEILSRTMDDAGAGHAVLCGASWGAATAAAFASNEPARIEAMVLGSIALSTGERMQRVIAEGQKLVRNGRSTELGAFIIERFGQFLDESMKRALVSQFGRGGEEAVRAFAAHAAAVAEGERLDALFDLKRITAPSLLVYGSHDPLLEPDAPDTTSRAMSNATVVVVPGAGHFLHLERNGEQIIDIYADFLRRVIRDAA